MSVVVDYTASPISRRELYTTSIEEIISIHLWIQHAAHVTNILIPATVRHSAYEMTVQSTRIVIRLSSAQINDCIKHIDRLIFVNRSVRCNGLYRLSNQFDQIL